MRILYKADFRRGFSLIELLVAIAILAILTMIAIPVYNRYVRQAELASYAMTVATDCLQDLMALCIESPGRSINLADGPRCNPLQRQVRNRTVTLSLGENFACGADGRLTRGSVIATIQGLPGRVVCRPAQGDQYNCVIE